MAARRDVVQQLGGFLGLSERTAQRLVRLSTSKLGYWPTRFLQAITLLTLASLGFFFGANCSTS